ncbi:hypothetical protein F0L68_04045 [Solihabitans fulvus]|uniref:DUF3995 domain-containing protein n=2 Tax=Solihabitans fulvus TaxID=1892852 RepID=A0A5B2XSD1_9PSEU|nr:hypothetical protein F0L68_04045 [Solihabitans fulvus]
MKTTWALGGTFAGLTHADLVAGASASWAALESFGVDPTALLAALGVFLLLGLVRPWGQVFPRWTVWLAGRRVPRWLPLAPALVGAATLAPYGVFGVGLVVLESVGVVPVERGQFRSVADALVVSWCGLGAFCCFGVALAVAAWSYLVRTRRRCVSV